VTVSSMALKPLYPQSLSSIACFLVLSESSSSLALLCASLANLPIHLGLNHDPSALPMASGVLAPCKSPCIARPGINLHGRAEVAVQNDVQARPAVPWFRPAAPLAGHSPLPSSQLESFVIISSPRARMMLRDLSLCQLPYKIHIDAKPPARLRR
jgi:hypothetical protein